MKFIRKSQNNYQFAVPEYIHLASDDVMIYDGTAYFKKSIFKNEIECQEWYENNVENGTMKFDQTKSITKTLYGIKASSGKPTEKEWEMIRSHMVNPDEFTIDDIKVYHPILANNFIDRDLERFSIQTMKGLVSTLPDKPLLLGHEGSGTYSSPGKGRFFDAKARKVSKEEMVSILGPYPYKDRDGLMVEVETEDKGLYVLDAAFYMLKDNPLVRDIDAGIAKDMSIRFRAERREAITDEDGKLKYFVYRGVSEALEGSFVWLGAQYGAQAQKSLVPEGSEKSKESLNPNSNEKETNQEVQTMKFKSKALGLDLEIEGEDLSLIEKEIEPKAEALVKQVETLDTELTAIKAEKEKWSKDQKALEELKTVFGEITVDQAIAIKEQAEARHTEMVEKAIKFGSLLNVIDKDKVEEKRKEFGEMSYPQIEERAKEYEKLYENRNVKEGQLEQKEEKIPFGSAVPESDFNLF